MNKKIVSTLLILAISLSLTACANTPAKNDASDTGSNSITSDFSESSQNVDSFDSSATTEERTSFWLASQKWDEAQRDSFEGVLFNSNAVLPIDITAIDSYGAPYLYYGYGDYDGTFSCDTISEIAESDRILQQTDDVNSNFAKVFTEISPTGEINIELFNFSDKDITVKECIDNGWWSINNTKSGLCIPDDLQMEHYWKQVDSEKPDHTDYLSAVIEKFGTPHYVWSQRSSKDEFYNILNSEQGTLYYALVYEYQDCVIKINLLDKCVDSEIRAEILSFSYFPKEMWQQYKTEVVDPHGEMFTIK